MTRCAVCGGQFVEVHQGGQPQRYCGKACQKRAAKLRHNPPTGVTIVGTVAVSCWCEAAIVMVPVTDVRAGRTGSCGRPSCREVA